MPEDTVGHGGALGRWDVQSTPTIWRGLGIVLRTANGRPRNRLGKMDSNGEDPGARERKLWFRTGS